MSACAALAGLALLRCLAANPACLPPERRPLLPVLEAMAAQEASLRPYAIRDERTDRPYYPATKAEAVRIAARLLRAGHPLGLGWFQITGPANQARHFGGHDRVEAMLALAFDPCRNLRAGADHLADGIRRYNGSGPAAERYAASVLHRVSRAEAAEATSEPPPPPPPTVAVFSRPAPGRALVVTTTP